MQMFASSSIIKLQLNYFLWRIFTIHIRSFMNSFFTEPQRHHTAFRNIIFIFFWHDVWRWVIWCLVRVCVCLCLHANSHYVRKYMLMLLSYVYKTRKWVCGLCGGAMRYHGGNALASHERQSEQKPYYTTHKIYFKQLSGSIMYRILVYWTKLSITHWK